MITAHSDPSHMYRPTSPSQNASRPPIVVVGVEQEWAARSLDTVLGPKGYAVVRAYSGRQTIDLAEVAAPDVVLIDSRLPDMDGVDVCRALRDEHRIGSHVPVVIMTSGSAPRDFLRAAYLAGAWSVWEQPIDGELLLLRLQTWIDAKRVVDEAERVSLVDVESGLYTNRGLNRRIREVMADAARRKTPVSCIAIGPVVSRMQSADAELSLPLDYSAALGKAVVSLARGSDVVGRTGASEFTIVAPMTGQDGAVELVERLRDKVAALPALNAGGRATRITLRAGMTTIAEPTAASIDGSELLLRASTALRYAQSSRATHIQRFDEVPITFV